PQGACIALGGGPGRPARGTSGGPAHRRQTLPHRRWARQWGPRLRLAQARRSSDATPGRGACRARAPRGGSGVKRLWITLGVLAALFGVGIFAVGLWMQTDSVRAWTAEKIEEAFGSAVKGRLVIGELSELDGTEAHFRDVRFLSPHGHEFMRLEEVRAQIRL